jgi:hypothetical protein
MPDLPINTSPKIRIPHIFKIRSSLREGINLVGKNNFKAAGKELHQRALNVGASPFAEKQDFH